MRTWDGVDKRETSSFYVDLLRTLYIHHFQQEFTY